VPDCLLLLLSSKQPSHPFEQRVLFNNQFLSLPPNMYQYWIISPTLNQNILYHIFSQYMCHYIKNTLTILGERKIREGDEECKDVAWK